MDIELRHLRSFVAVAEELSFTRAAQRLFIAQQALSTQIRQLEERIGTKLLVRTTRSVALTEAGEVLLAQARLLLADADTAVATTRAVGTGRTPLTVGFVAAVTHPDTSHVLDRFAADHADVDVMVSFGDLLDPTGGLHDGQVDVAFVYGPFDTKGLELTHLYTEPLGVALAEGHRLAAAETVAVADVVAEPTFDFPTRDRRWRDHWSGAAYREGLPPPRYVAQFRTLEGLIVSIRAGLGVYFATRSLVTTAGPGVVWRPLDAAPTLEHHIARRVDDERPLVQAIVDTAVATFAV